MWPPRARSPDTHTGPDPSRAATIIRSRLRAARRTRGTTGSRITRGANAARYSRSFTLVFLRKSRVGERSGSLRTEGHFDTSEARGGWVGEERGGRDGQTEFKGDRKIGK